MTLKYPSKPLNSYFKYFSILLKTNKIILIGKNYFHSSCKYTILIIIT